MCAASISGCVIAQAEFVDHIIIYNKLHVHTVDFELSIFLLMGEVSVLCDI